MTTKSKDKGEKQDLEELREEYKNLSDEDIDLDNTLYKNILNQLEILDKAQIQEETEFNYLYPNLNDSMFNVKIAEKQEFHELKTESKVYNVKKRSDELCNVSGNKEFELLPHQLFIHNYLSFQTPYNSLLLYHGLGTGKTCSAITVCEEMRDYLNQLGVTKRIIIVASLNVQDNFRLELFDKRKLQNINGIWNLNACSGNKYLKEINPMNMKGISKKDVIRQVNRIINQNYLFLGHEQFSNYIEKLYDSTKKNNINKEFSNRLIVIDEIHNIRTTRDSSNKRSVNNLLNLVKHTDNLKLLLLSATPMFNSQEEIIWLLNLMNLNDKRSDIKVSDVFDKDGFLIRDEEGREIGKELLIRKATGYISYLRGENPYTFPYRILPSMFMVEHTLRNYIQPRLQLNNAIILQPIDYLDLCITTIGNYQNKGYEYILQHNIDKLPKDDNGEKGLGYQVLNAPLQALNIVFPYDKLDKNEEFAYEELIGKRGLNRVMIYNTTTKNEFLYNDEILETYGPIFSLNLIGNYSSKIKFICESIKNSEGIVLIYSQYIDGGCIPMALALEEMGIHRLKNRNLFKTKRTSTIGNYIMITGDNLLSPQNKEEIDIATANNNKNGEKVKVIIISEAGSEGINLQNIRQIHIIDPWYNLSRIEQIIGRGVRNCSHKLLPFEQRNIEIYMYGTQLKNTEMESADMYVYRLAERKAIKIGQISRILKETSVDCLLGKNVLTESIMNQTVKLKLSTGITINYKVGDKPFSFVCDYLETCEYQCKPNKDITKVDITTYNETFFELNINVITNKIKNLFKDGYVFTKKDIIRRLNYHKEYPLTQINTALTKLVTNSTEYVFDHLERRGNLVNIGEYYMFQPIELNNENISYYDRSHPVAFKNKILDIKLPKKFKVIEDVNVIDIIKTHIKNAQKTHNLKTGRKEIEWYKVAGNQKNLILKYMSEIDYTNMIIEHILDTLEFNHKLQIYNYIFGKSKLTILEANIKKQMERNIIDLDNNKYILIGDVKENVIKYFVLNDKKFEKATHTQIETLLKYLIKNRKTDYNNIIGLMDNFKNSYVIFKFKNTTNPKDKGARCDQKGKLTILRLLNDIVGDETYTYDNTKDITNSKDICVLIEVILRYFDSIKKNNKFWFINFENTLLDKKIKK
uniref:Helicase ATP-binding domain-containing protein n=1 Tax=viral metagenome TaxID=1070528 RepID=A0A6C0KHP8_9ZZZZ